MRDASFEQGTTDKRALRAHYIARRQSVAGADRTEADTAIQRGLFGLLEQYRRNPFQGGSATPALGMYRAFRGEVDVLPLAEELRRMGWVTAFPKTDVETKSVYFYEVDESSEWVEGAYGIWEPAPTLRTVSADQLSVLIVPGVAFTNSGIRLGYGGGYYDRLLARPDVRALRIGVSFACQLAEELPYEAHDKVMDYILTEQGVARCAH